MNRTDEGNIKLKQTGLTARKKLDGIWKGTFPSSPLPTFLRQISQIPPPDPFQSLAMSWKTLPPLPAPVPELGPHPEKYPPLPAFFRSLLPLQLPSSNFPLPLPAPAPARPMLPVHRHPIQPPSSFSTRSFSPARAPLQLPFQPSLHVPTAASWAASKFIIGGTVMTVSCAFLELIDTH